MDLIKRRDYLKFKIIQSNAHTTVNIGSNEYTIAQAIDLKNRDVSKVFTSLASVNLISLIIYSMVTASSANPHSETI